MGATQSYLTPGAIAVVVGGSIAVHQFINSEKGNQQEAVKGPVGDSSSTPNTNSKKGKKKKKNAGSSSATGANASADETAENVVAFPDVVQVPGQFDADASVSKGSSPTPTPAPAPPTAAPAQAPEAAKSKKAKKKKGKAAPAPAPAPASVAATAGGSDSDSKPSPSTSSSSKLAGALAQSTASIDTEGWTDVGKSKSKAKAKSQRNAKAEVSTDTFSSVATGTTSSPVAERTEDEVLSSSDTPAEKPQENRRTLAEKLIPKPRKTGVEDMLSTPDVPPIARTMLIKPTSSEKPPPGYTWNDYEDVDTGSNEADEEEEDAWSVVPSKKVTRRPQTQSQTETQPVKPTAPEALTKKQRQNAAKREAEKASKAAAAEAQEAKLAAHKRQLEAARIAELNKNAKKGKEVSGGMRSSVVDGKLVWE